MFSQGAYGGLRSAKRGGGRTLSEVGWSNRAESKPGLCVALFLESNTHRKFSTGTLHRDGHSYKPTCRQADPALKPILVPARKLTWYHWALV